MEWGYSTVSATNVLPEKERLTLSDKNIPKALPGDELWDPNVRGLHLRCGATKKTFYLYYRTKAGVQRKPKLGEYGSITLSQVRKLAGEMWLEIGAGKDPSQANTDARNEKTLTDLWDEFRKRRGLKKKTAGEDERVWKKFLIPWAGSKKLSLVDYNKVADLHEEITENSGPVQANRILALLSVMFSFGVAPLRWVADNPTKGVEKNPEKPRRRYMSGAEAASIAGKLREKSVDYPEGVAFLYLLILTGARLGEISNARWDQIHGNKLVLGEHKTDQDGHDRVIQLPPVVMALLGRLPRTTGTITGIVSPRKMWRTIREDVGCPDLRIHDLRHSFAAAAISDGKTLAQVGELLGHGSAQTTKRYVHLQDETAALAASSIADRILAAMAPTEPAA